MIPDCPVFLKILLQEARRTLTFCPGSYNDVGGQSLGPSDTRLLCITAILKSIRNSLIFSLKNGYLLMFWRVKVKILLQAKLASNF